MKLARILEHLRGHRNATAEDIRNVFGDYHNVLHWLALFLIGEKKLADECVVDACSIAESQASLFHEWLVHWAAGATVTSALRIRRAEIAVLAPEYEKAGAVCAKHLPLTAESFQRLIENSEEIHKNLDVLCRFVLVLHGIAKNSCKQVAAQLRVSQCVAERAYSTAWETLDRISANQWQSYPAEEPAHGCYLKNASSRYITSQAARGVAQPRSDGDGLCRR